MTGQEEEVVASWAKVAKHMIALQLHLLLCRGSSCQEACSAAVCEVDQGQTRRDAALP
jgi:hypothetical protein